MTPAEEREAQRAALAALDRLIADAPPYTVEEAMTALRRIVSLRNSLVAAQRRGDRLLRGAHLAAVNAVLSLTWSGAVPVVGFRRQRLEAARAALAAVAPAADEDQDGDIR